MFLGQNIKTKLTLLKPQEIPDKHNLLAFKKAFNIGGEGFELGICLQGKVAIWIEGMVEKVLGSNTWIVSVNGREVETCITNYCDACFLRNFYARQKFMKLEGRLL